MRCDPVDPDASENKRQIIGSASRSRESKNSIRAWTWRQCGRRGSWGRWSLACLRGTSCQVRKPRKLSWFKYMWYTAQGKIALLHSRRNSLVPYARSRTRLVWMISMLPADVKPVGIKLLGFKPRSELLFEDNVKHSLFIYPDEMVRISTAPNDETISWSWRLTLGVNGLSPHYYGTC
jgi:hypothetical protein